MKTNQLQRIIRTGRTGHWLNHSKEHCLVGIKGNPEVNRNIDTDVVVAEVRETSRKPDEVSVQIAVARSVVAMWCFSFFHLFPGSNLFHVICIFCDAHDELIELHIMATIVIF